jgi:hypothetical protein
VHGQEKATATPTVRLRRKEILNHSSQFGVAIVSGRTMPRLAELIDQCLGLFEDRGLQSFGKPAVDRYENVASCGVLPLLEQ